MNIKRYVSCAVFQYCSYDTNVYLDMFVYLNMFVVLLFIVIINNVLRTEVRIWLLGCSPNLSFECINLFAYLRSCEFVRVSLLNIYSIYTL